MIDFLDNRLIPVKCIKAKAAYPIKRFDADGNPVTHSDPQLGEYGMITA